ncbi:MAG: S41 family peptidase [Ruminococcus sp.]|nr:S41 family peptidase [Ruminococcus sp.]
MKNRKSFLKGALCGALAMLLVAGLVSCGLKVNNGNSDITSKTEDKISELQNLIEKHYMGDVKEKNLEDGVYKGYINGLNDPYSVYYNKKETKELYESTGGEYSGIGAVMSQNTETGVITLVQIYKDSPAEKAGLKANDILYKVEGKEVTGKDLSKVVSKVKGEKGTTVELTVLRGEDAKEVTVTATRDTVQAQTIEYKMMDDKIGYIRVSEFDTVTYDQYKEALDDLEKQGMTGLVVDLRNNPGGSLSTVCDMLDLMLPKGLIVYTEDKNGKKTKMKSDEEHQFTKPLAVLVNGNSASASEIYSGAIQDYGICKIVGTQTYGKGVVQQIFDLDDGTAVKLTIAEYFTPKGRSINGKGITPDVKVEYENNEENPDADNQLDKAVEEVKAQMK